MINKNKIIIGCCVFLHLILFFVPSVNQEFAFVDAARYFQSGQNFLIEQYFSYQANTLGMPYIGWLLSHFVSFDMLWVMRGISVFGIILLGLGIINFSKFLNKNEVVHYILLFVLLNPLVWVYSGRATADFFPAALGFFAFSLVLTDKLTHGKSILIGIFLGLAMILKYHTVCFLFFLLAWAFYQKNEKNIILMMSTIFCIALGLLAGYLIWVYFYFGFWITPPMYQTVHRIQLSNLVNNFSLYVGYLVMLCLPVSFFLPGAKNFLKKYWAILSVLSFVLFMLGFFGLKDGGEMNLGPLDRYINPSIVAGMFLVLSSLFLLYFVYEWRGVQSKENKINRIFGVAILMSIMLFSASRPAQRYLLVVLPFFVFMLPGITVFKKSILKISLLLYILVDVFIMYSQWCTGTASIEMTKIIREKGWIELTDPGAIESHVGDQFFVTRNYKKQYVVVVGDNKGALVRVQKGLGLMKKTSSLVLI